MLGEVLELSLGKMEKRFSFHLRQVSLKGVSALKIKNLLQNILVLRLLFVGLRGA